MVMSPFERSWTALYNLHVSARKSGFGTFQRKPIEIGKDN